VEWTTLTYFFVFFEALILKFQEFIQLPQELYKFPVFLFHGEALAKDMQAFSFIRGHACALSVLGGS
jgi:hypothetical protein